MSMVKKSLFSLPSSPQLKDPEWWTSTAVNLVTMNPGGLAVDLSKLLLPKDGGEEKLYRQLDALYLEAFRQTLQQTEGIEKPPAIRYTKDNVDAEQALLSIRPGFPTHHPLYKDLFDQAKKALNLNDAHLPLCKPSFRSTFGRCFEHLRADRERFGVIDVFLRRLTQGFDTPESLAAEHLNQVLISLEQDHLPILEDITLPQIYITPRARSQRYTAGRSYSKERAHALEVGHDGGQKVVEVPNLIAALLKTLEGSTAPIVVHGQPGHGKTSSMRMLCHALSTQQRFLEGAEQAVILLYEFKNLGDLNRNEIQVLASETSFLQEKSFFHRRQTLLIIDGMDERQITDGTDNAFKSFIRRLFDLADKLNQRQDGTRLHLVLTGRSQFVQQVQGSLGSDYHLFEIKDFDQAQVQRWLERFAKLRRLEKPLTYEELRTAHLEELTEQPILLTISAPMLVDQRGQELLQEHRAEDISRGRIYGLIIRWTFEKNGMARIPLGWACRISRNTWLCFEPSPW